MLVEKFNQAQTIIHRKKEYGDLSSVHVNSSPSRYMSPKLNSLNIERPLKNNSENLSFKGLSFMGENSKNKNSGKKKPSALAPTLAMLGTLAGTGLILRLAPSYKKVGSYSMSEFTEFTDKYLGPMGKELLEDLKNSPFAKKMIKTNGDTMTLSKKTVPQLIWDGLKYPFTILPADILNGTVQLLGKIKPLESWSKSTLQKPLFKNIRQRSKIDAKINSLRGLVKTKEELLGKLSKGEIDEKQLKAIMDQRSVKMFDPKTGNYDTKHERSLNRLVSGLPPAIFLANDAYNLSRMMDDDKKSASKEQKIRFKQEMARIGFNAYITLVTLGALQKYINNSKMGIMLMTAATTLTTEAFSRVINGKHITRLTPEEARKENEKNNAPEAKIKPDISFKSKENINHKENKEKVQKPLLSFNSVMKAVGAIIVGGFAIKGLRKISLIDNAWVNFSKKVSNKYNSLTQIKDYTISQDKLDKITRVLEENGFKDLAEKYQNIAKANKTSDGKIHLGAKDKKIKPLIDFALAPFKFIWKYGTLPYTAINDAISSFSKKTVKKAKDIKEIETLAKSIDNIGREALKKDLNPKEFQSYVKDNILKAFNVDSMSNVSNSELSNLAKTAALAATIWFLMTDNYNMVMLKSNGNDVEGAKTKFTERFVQEGSRLFYQTLLIDLFNSTFRTQYNKSLFGMSWITLTNTTMGEWLTRKSVGVPVGTHSRQELIDLENKQNNATGFKKSYYDFMKRLTGKRSIQSYNVKKEDIKNLQPDFKTQKNL